jgi:serine/threonine protein kinase
MAEIFISYAREDAAAAERLASALEDQGWVVFWDRRIPAGRRYSDVIAENLASAKCVIALWSRAAAASDWVLDEAEEARKRDVLTPARLEAVDPPMGFRRIHAADLIDWKGEVTHTGFQYLLQDVKRFAPLAASEPAEIAKAPRDEAPRAHVGAPTPSFRDVRVIHQSRYTLVRKVISEDTGEVSIVKETDAALVSRAALERIRELNHPNVLAPLRIWGDGRKVFEQLPYVGGIRLSAAVERSFGGLRGCVLEDFYKTLRSALSALHGAGVIHRDVHPDNIYLVVKPAAASGARRFKDYPYGDSEPFGLRWILVDSTFAVTTEDDQPPCRHGSYTPEEQERGFPLPASDIHALGGTMYFGIVGADPPPAHDRGDPVAFARSLPDAHYPDDHFTEHLVDLLSPEPAVRLSPARLTEPGTTPVFDVGALRVSDTAIAVVSNSVLSTRLLPFPAALRHFQDRRTRLVAAQKSEQARQTKLDPPMEDPYGYEIREATHWTERLETLLGVRR